MVLLVQVVAQELVVQQVLQELQVHLVQVVLVVLQVILVLVVLQVVQEQMVLQVHQDLQVLMVQQVLQVLLVQQVLMVLQVLVDQVEQVDLQVLMAQADLVERMELLVLLEQMVLQEVQVLMVLREVQDNRITFAPGGQNAALALQLDQIALKTKPIENHKCTCKRRVATQRHLDGRRKPTNMKIGLVTGIWYEKGRFREIVFHRDFLQHVIRQPVR